MDGTRIREEWTVGDSRLDLENEVDDDSEDGIPEIHVVLEQHGGSSFTGDVHCQEMHLSVSVGLAVVRFP